jgi:putative tryptophan/tyrosine transport system permease protein
MFVSVIEQILIFLSLIIGAYLSLSLLKLPDFAIESAYLFGAVTAFLAKDLPVPLMLCSGIAGGAVVGMVTSILNQWLHFPYLLAAIVTNGLFHGLSLYLLGTSNSSFYSALPFSELTLLIGIGVLLVGIVAAGLRSQLGYSFAIYGNNPLFFQNHQLSGGYVLFSGVVLAHGFAGLSGFLFAQSNGFIDTTMNFGILLLCLTALMIGTLFIRTVRPNVLVPLIGVSAYFIIQQVLLNMDLNLKYFNTLQALVIIIILSLRKRRQTFNLDHLGV